MTRIQTFFVRFLLCLLMAGMLAGTPAGASEGRSVIAGDTLIAGEQGLDLSALRNGPAPVVSLRMYENDNPSCSLIGEIPVPDDRRLDLPADTDEFGRYFCWNGSALLPRDTYVLILGTARPPPPADADPSIALRDAPAGAVRNLDTGSLFASIQSAIDDPATDAGDTIRVEPGIYREKISVTKRIVLSGNLSDGTRPVIRAVDNGTAITLLAGSIAFSGFTVENTEFGGEGTGIHAVSSGNRIEDTLVRWFDEGIVVSSSVGTSLGSVEALENGNGVSILSSTGTRLSGIAAEGNARDGLYVRESDATTVTGCVLAGNTNGIHLFTSDGCTLDGNRAEGNAHDGIFLSFSDRTVITDHLSADNDCGIYFSMADATTVGASRILGNRNGVYLASEGNTVTGTTVSANACGIYLYQATGNTFFQNAFTNDRNTEMIDSSNRWTTPLPYAYEYRSSSYTGYIGNYWSGYAGTDAAGDGIGDVPHGIGGDTDAAPLMEPPAGYRLAGAIPVAGFSLNRTSGTAPLAIKCTDLSAGSPAFWDWDFGDGRRSAEQNPVHSYLANGIYTVRLTAGNAFGSTTATSPAPVIVGIPVIPLRGYTAPPLDLDADGTYEDLNANGEMDFVDVILYFREMDWIGKHEYIPYFDYNQNAVIDFNDVILLFRRV